MHLPEFGHYFEFFAGLNLAYAGIDKFRRKVFEILSALFTPEDLKPAFDSVANKTEVLKGFLGEGSEAFVHKVADIQVRYDTIKKQLDNEDEAFLSDVASTRPLFLIGFLYCLNNLIVIGFEQFFLDKNALIAEQWLSVSAILMLLVNRDSDGKVNQWLRHHIGVILGSTLLLTIALAIGACPYEFPGISYSQIVTAIIAVLIPVMPLGLDYLSVRSHTTRRNKAMQEYIDGARAQLSTLNTAAEMFEEYKIHTDTPAEGIPTKIEPDDQQSRNRRLRQRDIFDKGEDSGSGETSDANKRS